MNETGSNSLFSSCIVPFIVLWAVTSPSPTLSARCCGRTALASLLDERRQNVFAVDLALPVSVLRDVVVFCRSPSAESR